MKQTKQTKQVKTLKRLVGMLLVLVMAFQMPLGMVKAEGQDIGASDFVQQPETNEWVCELSEGEYGTITIPDSSENKVYRLVVNGAITVANIVVGEGSFLEITNTVNVTDSVTLSEDSTVEIRSSGDLNCTTLNVSQNAFLTLEGKPNVPKVNNNSLELWSWNPEANNGQGALEDVAGTDFSWRTFKYGLDESNNGAWFEHAQQDPSRFFVILEGMEEGIGIRVSYSYDRGNNWIYPIEGTSAQNYHRVTSGELRYEEIFECNVYECEFFLSDIPDPNSVSVNVKIEVDNQTTSKVLSGPFEMDGLERNYTIDETVFQYNYSDYTVSDSGPHDIHLAMVYKDAGDKAIKEEVNNYLYAYSGNEDDIKNKLARELYDRFIRVAMFEDFGISNENELKDRITSFTADGTTNVIKQDGTEEGITKYTATVSWGVDRNSGEPVQSVIPVYVIDNDQILICTDFNEDNGTCPDGTLYIRKQQTDEVDFSSTQDRETDAGFLILAANYGNVVAGGNYLNTEELNTTGMYSFHASNDEGINVDVRILKPGNDYIVIHGSGEDKNVDGLGLNATPTDTIWQTGNGCTARVYVGDYELTLKPIEGSIISNSNITDVKLLDESMRDGVEITSIGNNSYTIRFNSNFYSSVPIVITYEDGTTQNITIERIGLVIQYIYLEDQGGGPANGQIDIPCNNGNLVFTYDYYGSQEQILVYATYYHPSHDNTNNAGGVILHLDYDNGTERYISYNDNFWTGGGYVGANTGVATTSFFIGFAPAHDQYGANIISQNIGGFHATVLNSGYDNPTNYGGTQIGSGLGVYWDGQIEWYD